MWIMLCVTIRLFTLGDKRNGLVKKKYFEDEFVLSQHFQYNFKENAAC